MSPRHLVYSMAFFIVSLVAAAAQDEEESHKADVLERLKSGGIQFVEADEAWDQLKAAIAAKPDENWFSMQLSLARVFAYKQQFDTAIEILKQGFDYHIQKLAGPEKDQHWFPACEFAKEIAVYAGRSSTPRIGDEALDAVIPLLQKKVASSGSPDSHSRLLSSAIALRSQSLPADKARKLIDEELLRTQNDVKANPENRIASFALIEAMKGVAIPPYQGGQIELKLVNELLQLATNLRDQQGVHKLGWGIEFCELNRFVIDRILNDFPDEAQRILDDALEQLDDAGKNDDLFSQQTKLYRDNLERSSSKIADAKRYLAIVGTPSPPFDAAAWPNGEPTELQELRGRVVLLDFTAVWCGPCIAQLPELKALHKEFQERGLVIISVTEQYDYAWNDETNSPEKVGHEIDLPGQVEMLEKFVRRYEIPFRLMVLKKDSTFGKCLGEDGIPHAVLIDGNGIVRMIRSGNTPVNALDLRRQIESLISSPRETPRR